LRAAGYRVGLYTSPHLQEFRERIRILTLEDSDGRISESQFVALMEKMKTAVATIPDITWFELVTGLAFLHFARQKVDIAVIEVGLGGRLDATNVLTPLVSVITSLSYDHTDLLGDTLSQIAWEKGGIIKPGVPVVIAPQQLEAAVRLRQIAAERQSPLDAVGDTWQFDGRSSPATDDTQRITITRSPAPFIPPRTVFRLALAGAHQQENAVVAIAALNAVQPHLPRLTLAAIQQGLATVQWNGRLQRLHHAHHTPDILVDCAHNAYSAAQLRHALTHNYRYNRLWLIFGASAGKDLSAMLNELLPLAQGAIATAADHPRAAPPQEIVRQAAQLQRQMSSQPNVVAALRAAWANAAPGDLICVTGSIFVVGDLLNQWENLRLDLLWQINAAVDS